MAEEDDAPSFLHEADGEPTSDYERPDERMPDHPEFLPAAPDMGLRQAPPGPTDRPWPGPGISMAGVPEQDLTPAQVRNLEDFVRTQGSPEQQAEINQRYPPEPPEHPEFLPADSEQPSPLGVAARG